MDNLPTGIGGIALIVIGALVAWKAAKAFVKLAMLVVIVVGGYLLWTSQAGG